MKGYIYKYTFPDGKIYIGQTRRPIEKRHAEHLNPTTGPMNPSFWKAYQNVGMPKLSILEIIEADNVTELVDILNDLETAYIYKEKATNPAYGYNRVHTGMVPSPDRTILNKEYIRLCTQAEEENRPFFDSVYKKLLSGNRDSLTDEERYFVDNYVDHNNLFSYHNNDNDNNSASGEVDGFWLGETMDYAEWLYMEEIHENIGQHIRENAEEIISQAKRGKIKRTIQQLDKDGNIVREFEYMDEIREAFNVVRIDNILNVLKGRQKTAYGFRWRYKLL